jgi:16S rRNA (uracil1498-N3)-methyltransferase
VNLLLLDAAELTSDAVVLRDRRAAHLRDILGVVVGQQVRAGIIGGRLGTAEVLADDGVALTLRVTAIEEPSPPLPVEVVLAVPRPKVLTRVIEALASFAVERITLTNAWRVDKSYLDSPRLAEDALTEAVRLGAEQGVTTHLPPVTVHRRLMALLDARWPAGVAGVGLVAHPGAPPIEEAPLSQGPIALAIGPEGGWLPREVETLVARGFTPVSLGPAILRVETALAAALGQLSLLLRTRSSR